MVEFALVASAVMVGSIFAVLITFALGFIIFKTQEWICERLSK